MENITGFIKVQMTLFVPARLIKSIDSFSIT